MQRKIIIGSVAILIVITGYYLIAGNKDGASSDILTTVKKGEFRIEIETTGELEAKNSVKIMGPGGLRNFQIWQVTIQSIVDEGTIVKKGDWVATLDRSEFQNKFSQKQIDYEKATSKFVQTQLDTTLTLREARDELINLKYGVEEKEIILEQSKFEPPATIKQAEINRDKAQRAFDQALENYKIKSNQSREKIREVEAELRKVRSDYEGMTVILEAFNVLAPEDGMVIYEKGWDGKPIKGGSQIHMWEPTVATLPDLTKMVSKTYVNEVDVRKVKPGQIVEIGLDAYPEKQLTGKVIRVANVGEQRPNSDAKVFEVTVEMEGSDPTLRPSMTTSNKIIVKTINESNFIPLECLHNKDDSINYVFKNQGLKIIKQEVIVGETNANEAIILGGLTTDDQILLSIPLGMEEEDIVLLPELDGKRMQQEDEEEKVTPSIQTRK